MGVAVNVKHLEPNPDRVTVIQLNGASGGTHWFKCDDIINFVPINPCLPKYFDDTKNEERPESHRVWWNIPFIVLYESDEKTFVERWGGNLRWDVRCLDGGAWDRSTVWGSYGTPEGALARAKAGSPFKKTAAIPGSGPSDS